MTALAATLMASGILALIGWVWWDRATQRGVSLRGFVWWMAAVGFGSAGYFLLDSPSRINWLFLIGFSALIALSSYGFFYGMSVFRERKKLG